MTIRVAYYIAGFPVSGGLPGIGGVMIAAVGACKDALKRRQQVVEEPMKAPRQR